ncbi:MAG: hypothetical protein ABJE95_08805 [Byssovorax sp.]
MAILELIVGAREGSLSVRRFVVEEGMSVPFRITITARSPRADLDLDSIVGKPAALRAEWGIEPVWRIDRLPGRRRAAGLPLGPGDVLGGAREGRR